MFGQIGDPGVAGKKSWKERLTEGAIILVVIAVAVALLFYAVNA